MPMSVAACLHMQCALLAGSPCCNDCCVRACVMVLMPRVSVLFAGEQVGITGAILTKMDGDARGGAALSVREVSACQRF